MSDALNTQVLKSVIQLLSILYFCTFRFFFFLHVSWGLSRLMVLCSGRDESFLCVSIMQGGESPGKGSSVAGRDSLARAETLVNGKPLS